MNHNTLILLRYLTPVEIHTAPRSQSRASKVVGNFSPRRISRALRMIKTEHLTKHYGSLFAVEDASFEVRPGEVLGFLGPNGAGKTTTMRMLAGFVTPTSGR